MAFCAFIERNGITASNPIPKIFEIFIMLKIYKPVTATTVPAPTPSTIWYLLPL